MTLLLYHSLTLQANIRNVSNTIYADKILLKSSTNRLDI